MKISTNTITEIKPMKHARRIPERTYRNIERMLPIICVDLVIRRRGRVLLVRRTCKPLMGKWWVPGGRLLRGERISAAVKRIAGGEVGLKLSGRPVGIYEGFYKNRHSVSVVCECDYGGGEILLDSQSSGFKWGKLPSQLL